MKAYNRHRDSQLDVDVQQEWQEYKDKWLDRKMSSAYDMYYFMCRLTMADAYDEYEEIEKYVNRWARKYA